MLAVGSFQAGPDLNLSWILFILFGLFFLVIVIGAIASGLRRPPDSRADNESIKPSKRAIKKTLPTSPKK